MGLNYYASAPTLVLPPPSSTNLFGDGPNSSHSLNPPPTNFRPRFPRPPSINYLATSANLAGRKRSRDEVAAEHEDLDDGSRVAPVEPPKPRPEPIMGPGMTLIYPDEPGFSIAADSQTGTWAEEKKQAEDEAATTAASSRPMAVSRKSARRPAPADLESVSPTAALCSSSTPRSPEDGIIDRLTLVLGVGWKRVYGNDAVADAARGWARYIENHYPLAKPTIMLHSERLQAYLVHAFDPIDSCEGFWLFQDELKFGQAVGESLDAVVANLTAQAEIRFEGEPIRAQSRRPSDPSSITVVPQPMNGAVAVAVAADVDMSG
ncbi:hypothetical protein BDY21DRAFT_283635 [Lineolata rhizophorae]|uniref:Uncharacterized protein n=1 Tax=Lineolata rhizophorae TaxID=578093 RepID=A0A6A6P4J2_9PEZI|nr:hypothetical protein BDY21DRAFT_283635 [Lineolata rhizophorae]